MTGVPTGALPSWVRPHPAGAGPVAVARAGGATGAAGARAGGAGRPVLRRVARAVRHPRWLLGLGLAGAGTVVHAVALLLAPLRVVQPVGVLAVPVAVLLASLRTRRRPSAGVVVGVLLSVLGVVGFVAASAGSTTSSPPPGASTLVAGLAVGAVVAALAVLGVRRSGWAACLCLATGAAAAFGLVSALVRAVSQAVASGDVPPTAPPVLAAGAGVVLALLAGGWLVQHAYTAGAPELVVACLTVVDPVVAVLLGAVLLGEGAATPPALWAVLGLAAAAAALGVVTLARHHPDAVAARAAAHGAPVAVVAAPAPVPRAA
ncbi:multidrug transporter [Puerhibacterium sp. TATVAM-FAB25]|uniref:multidrug transporter n=1 Tax=Puerhibacterium sp. TATVAM-FAB25 TaxID=3093699 RepID=UPI00397C23B7